MIGLIILNCFMDENQMLKSIWRQKRQESLKVFQMILVKVFKGKVRLKLLQEQSSMM